jgi:hypothetical protein
MLFAAFQEVVAGIADNGRERRQPNCVRRPATSTESSFKHLMIEFGSPSPLLPSPPHPETTNIEHI